jgi:hypothetical protein
LVGWRKNGCGWLNPGGIIILEAPTGRFCRNSYGFRDFRFW